MQHERKLSTIYSTDSETATSADSWAPALTGNLIYPFREQMLFTWDTKNLCIVFRQWHIRSTTGLVVSLLAVVALGAGYEALREASRRYEHAVNKRVDAVPRTSPFSSSQLSLSELAICTHHRHVSLARVRPCKNIRHKSLMHTATLVVHLTCQAAFIAKETINIWRLHPPRRSRA